MKSSFINVFAMRIARNARAIGRDDRGAEIAETAVVLPMAFMMLFAVFWFGQAFALYGTITHAARLGARAGAAPYCSTCAAGNTSSLNARAAVAAALQAAKLNVTNASYPVPQPTLVSCANGTTQPCTGANVCIQDSIQLSNTGNGGAGVCGISVSFRYPYKFWLPFTSIDRQQIWLTAQARMRSETR